MSFTKLIRMVVPPLILCSVALHFAAAQSDPAIKLTAGEKRWLSAHPVVRVAPDPSFAPVEWFDKKGRFQGMAKNFLELMTQRTGIQFEIVQLSNWDEVLKKARLHEVDMLSAATKTPQRAEYLNFTAPYIEIPAVIIVREDLRGPLDLKALQQKQMFVGVTSGYAEHDFLKNNHPQLNLIVVPDVTTGLKKVAFGMSDSMIASVAIATYYIKKDRIPNLRVAGETGYVYGLGFATRKDWPELNAILEKALRNIPAEKKTAILEQWISLELDLWGLIQKYLKYILSALGMAVLVGFLIWIKVLRVTVQSRTIQLHHELNERKLAQEALKLRNETMQDDLNLAAEFQLSVLPRMVDLPFLVSDYRYLPHDEVSGDIYDWYSSDDGSLNFFLGDATGHGVTAALLSMMVQIGLDGMHGNLPTNTICQNLNRLIATRDKGGKFITGVFFRITPGGELLVTNAGHPPLVVISATNPEPAIFESSSLPIGMFLELPVPYVERKYKLAPGDRIFVFTDGLTEWENMNAEQFGFDRLLDYLQENRPKSLESLFDGLMREIGKFSEGVPCNDDLTLFAFEYRQAGR